MLNDMIWKYNIVTIDRVVLCLVSMMAWYGSTVLWQLTVMLFLDNVKSYKNSHFKNFIWYIFYENGYYINILFLCLTSFVHVIFFCMLSSLTFQLYVFGYVCRHWGTLKIIRHRSVASSYSVCWLGQVNSKAE